MFVTRLLGVRIGAANTMLLGGAIAIVATVLIGWLWRPIREYRSD